MNGSTEFWGNTKQVVKWPWMADWDFDKGLNANRIIQLSNMLNQCYRKRFPKTRADLEGQEKIYCLMTASQTSKDLVKSWDRVCLECIISHNKMGQSMSRMPPITYLHMGEGSVLAVDLEPSASPTTDHQSNIHTCIINLNCKGEWEKMPGHDDITIWCTHFYERITLTWSYYIEVAMHMEITAITAFTLQPW